MSKKVLRVARSCLVLPQFIPASAIMMQSGSSDLIPASLLLVVVVSHDWLADRLLTFWKMKR